MASSFCLASWAAADWEERGEERLAPDDDDLTSRQLSSSTLAPISRYGHASPPETLTKHRAQLSAPPERPTPLPSSSPLDPHLPDHLTPAAPSRTALRLQHSDPHHPARLHGFLPTRPNSACSPSSSSACYFAHLGPFARSRAPDGRLPPLYFFKPCRHERRCRTRPTSRLRPLSPPHNRPPQTLSRSSSSRAATMALCGESHRSSDIFHPSRERTHPFADRQASRADLPPLLLFLLAAQVLGGVVGHLQPHDPDSRSCASARSLLVVPLRSFSKREARSASSNGNAADASHAPVQQPNRLAISPDKRFLAVAGVGTVKLYDIAASAAASSGNIAPVRPPFPLSSRPQAHSSSPHGLGIAMQSS